MIETKEIKMKLDNKTTIELMTYLNNIRIKKFNTIEINKLNKLLEKAYALCNNEEGNHEWM